MKLVNLKEHQSCGCYTYLPQVGFNLLSLEQGEFFAPTCCSVNRFIFICKGEVTFSFDDEVRYSVPKHSFLFTPIEKPFCIEANTSVTLVFLNTLVVESVCSRISIPFLNDVYSRIAAECLADNYHRATQAIICFFKSIESYLAAGFCCIELHRVKEREFFLLLRASFTVEELSQLFSPLFENMSHFKARVLTLSLQVSTVSELSQRMNIERSHFHKLFKQRFEISPYQWMLQQKEAQTLEYLRNKQTPLKSIAAELKFASPSHLNLFCKKRFGKTAKEIQDALLSVQATNVP